jgi:hypothetical protein
MPRIQHQPATERRQHRADGALDERRIADERELDADLVEAPGEAQTDHNRRTERIERTGNVMVFGGR